MKKAWLNKKYIAKLACRWTTGVFSLLGIVGTFVSLSEIAPEEWPAPYKILLSLGIVAVVWLFFFIACSIWFEKKKWIEIIETNNDCHVYVQYGDVFSADEVGNPNERRTIVIPVNRCFDTIVDNDLVSEKSLHGIAFKKLYTTGKYNENTLDIAIQVDLNNRQKIAPDLIARSEKRKGNLKRYPIGTVSEIEASNNVVFFFMALSTFDQGLTAHTTQEEYVLAMQRLIEYCNSRSQGYSVVMPLIGGGLSKTKNSERSILEYVVKLLKMNKNLITNDIHIVVRNSGKDVIPITEL